jgi:hypothetical protein
MKQCTQGRCAFDYQDEFQNVSINKKVQMFFFGFSSVFPTEFVCRKWVTAAA